MAKSHSDALVIFGVTGDLAHKMIFPALCSIVKKGSLCSLGIPIIGVAFPKWSMARLQKRVMDSIDRQLTLHFCRETAGNERISY